MNIKSPWLINYDVNIINRLSICHCKKKEKYAVHNISFEPRAHSQIVQVSHLGL